MFDGGDLPAAECNMLTAFGIVSATTMVVAYACESRDRRWIVVFAVGCLATAVYGVLSGAWIFAVLEVVWAGIAAQRFRTIEAVPTAGLHGGGV